MKQSQDLIVYADGLEDRAEQVVKTQFVSGNSYWVNPTEFARLSADTRLFLLRLGSFGDVWKSYVATDLKHTLVNAQRLNGAITSFRQALDGNQLWRVEESIEVEVLGDLMDQAGTLLLDGYFLACCVVQRAVLEERLRKLCDKWQCLPTKAKPGIEDFNQSLYAQGKTDTTVDYHKATMQWVTSIAATGNDAAHNLRPIDKDDAERMRRELISFLSKFAP